MAKSVKEKTSSDVEISQRTVNSLIKRVRECHDDLETARGSYMNRARRIKETLATVYEGAAAEGIPQKVSKLQWKIEQTLEKLRGLYADLEREHQVIAQKVLKARGDKVQLTLFADMKPKPLTAEEKKAKAEAEKKAAEVAKRDAEAAKAAEKAAKSSGGKKALGATGQDIDDAEKAAEAARIAAAESEGPAPVLN